MDKKKKCEKIEIRNINEAATTIIEFFSRAERHTTQNLASKPAKKEKKNIIACSNRHNNNNIIAPNTNTCAFLGFECETD